VVPDSFVLSAQLLQNSMWKESRGRCDWVIVTAIDEHLYHRRVGDYLASCAGSGITAVPALGFEMVATDFPAPDEHLASSRTIGAPSAYPSKLSIFNPSAIDETNYQPGRHLAAPSGNVVYPPADTVLNLRGYGTIVTVPASGYCAR